jgi:hypothetical protein
MKPIIMSAESVRAILDGRKTQTRRVVKPQPAWNAELEMWVWPNALHGYASCYPTDGLIDWLTEHSPYPVGSRWWVRETWVQPYEWIVPGYDPNYHRALYKASSFDTWGCGYEFHWDDIPDRFWRSPITMPRWASRLTVEVVETTVEQQDGVWVWSTRVRRVQ